VQGQLLHQKRLVVSSCTTSGAVHRLRTMRTLFKKWRLVRWIYKELLGHEQANNMATPGQAMLLSTQAAVDDSQDGGKDGSY
jgi:hypothetical protein